MQAGSRIEDQVAGVELDRLHAIGVGDLQLPAVVVARVRQEQGGREVGAQLAARARVQAHAAVVAVDLETGAIELLDYAIVADCGTQVNPLLVEGQVLGGFSNGLGNALYEESSYDALGQPTATTLADYTAPTAPSIPEVKIDFIETPSPFSMFGMKGIGENGAICPPAAIVNAVNDALRPLSAAVFETPVTASRVRAAIVRAQSLG